MSDGWAPAAALWDIRSSVWTHMCRRKVEMMCLWCGHICSSMRTHVVVWGHMCSKEEGHRVSSPVPTASPDIYTSFCLAFLLLLVYASVACGHSSTCIYLICFCFCFSFFSFFYISLPVASGHSSANFCIHVCARSRYRYVVVSGHKC